MSAWLNHNWFSVIHWDDTKFLLTISLMDLINAINTKLLFFIFLLNTSFVVQKPGALVIKLYFNGGLVGWEIKRASESYMVGKFWLQALFPYLFKCSIYCYRVSPSHTPLHAPLIIISVGGSHSQLYQPEEEMRGDAMEINKWIIVFLYSLHSPSHLTSMGSVCSSHTWGEGPHWRPDSFGHSKSGLDRKHIQHAWRSKLTWAEFKRHQE